MLFFSFLLLINFLGGSAQAEVIPLATKQSIKNIRFISESGKFTYYSRRSGSLILSTNFDAKTILDGEMGDSYIISGSVSENILIIEKLTQFHHRFSPTRLHQLYTIRPDGTDLKKMAKGRYPKIHMNGKWMSYVDLEKRQLVLQNLEIKSQNYKINLLASHAPLHNPERVFLDQENFLYTDITSEGNHQLIKFNPLKQKFIKQMSFPKMSLIQLCQMKNQVFLFLGNKLELGGSKIFKLPVITEKFRFQTPFYTSAFKDLGSLYCSKKFNKLFIVKAYKALDEINHDIFEVDPQTGKAQQVTNLRHLHQFFTMDQQILVHHNGETYVAKGKFIESEFKLDTGKGTKK